MKVLNVVGARPQFVKLKPVHEALKARGVSQRVVHTGQHYDFGLSGSFFVELELPKPEENLEVGSESHARQVAAMLEGLEDTIRRERPAMIVVYGDTNSTLAGALAARMLGVPLCHVEAGARSFNRAMPEERNRIVADVLSDLLLTASMTATQNLMAEGIRGKVQFIGDTMLDVTRWACQQEQDGGPGRPGPHELRPREYYVATVHRAENTDNRQRLDAVLDILTGRELPVLFPIHPRTVAAVRACGWERRLSQGSLRTVAPLSYCEMMRAVGGARAVLTDSGGLQKEALYLGVQCITLRDETEWVETLEGGWNTLVGTSEEAVRNALRSAPSGQCRNTIYGDGHAGEKAAEAIVSFLHRES